MLVCVVRWKIYFDKSANRLGYMQELYIFFNQYLYSTILKSLFILYHFCKWKLYLDISLWKIYRFVLHHYRIWVLSYYMKIRIWLFMHYFWRNIPLWLWDTQILGPVQVRRRQCPSLQIVLTDNHYFSPLISCHY